MSQSRIQKKTEVQIAFGKRLKSKRQELELTQEELAEKAGLTYSYLGSIERGERNVSLGNIVALAEALMISPKELMPNSPQEKNKQHAKIELGKQLKSKRLEQGYTQEDLADIINLKARDVDNFERGRVEIHFDIMIALAKALHISPKELMPDTLD